MFATGQVCLRKGCRRADALEDVRMEVLQKSLVRRGTRMTSENNVRLIAVIVHENLRDIS